MGLPLGMEWVLFFLLLLDGAPDQKGSPGLWPLQSEGLLPVSRGVSATELAQPPQHTPSGLLTRGLQGWPEALASPLTISGDNKKPIPFSW